MFERWDRLWLGVKSPRRLDLLVMLLLWYCGMARAQQLIPDREYVITNWQSEHGLPENSATAMVQTPDGYLWFGTFNGLVRFDGVAFTTYHPANIQEMKSPAVVSLHLDRSGRLWASTAEGLLSRQDGRWQLYGPDKGWPTGDYVRWFAESTDGTLCASTFSGRIFRLAGGRFEKLPDPCDSGKGAYFCYAGGDGHIHVIRTGCAAVFKDGVWQPESLGAPARLDSPHGWGVNREGKLLQTEDEFIRILDGGRVVRETRLPERLLNFWDIRPDSLGNLWFCSYQSGLFRISPDGRLRRFTIADGLPTDSIRFVFEDRERNLWVGTSGGGLLRFRPRRFLSYGPESGLPRDPVKSVATSRSGRVYAATYGSGVFEIGEKGVSRFPDKRFQGFAQCLLVDRLDRLWIGAFQAGLRVPDPVMERRHAATAESITALFEDSKGRVWIGSSEGPLVMQDGVFTPIPLDSAASAESILCFAEDPREGTIWAGSMAGLWRMEGGRFSEIRAADGKSIRGVTALLADGEGALWLGTAANGLSVRMPDFKWVSLLESGLPVRAIGGILEDEGFLWLATHRGIWRARKSEVVAAARSGGGTRLVWQVFGTGDGLPSMECPIGYQPTLARDNRGRLWFSTLKGLAVVDPHKIEAVSGPLPLYVEDIRYVDQQGQDGHAEVGGRSDPVLPRGSRNIEISYTALEFSAPEKVVFIYELKSGGKVVSSGQRHDRKVSFHQLEPGKYQFSLWARNSDGISNERPLSLAIVVAPFYWETLWFRVLAVVLAAGSIFGATWALSQARLLRAREQLERERQVAELRARLALVLENTNDAVVFARADQHIFYLNPAARRLIGIPAEAGLGNLTLSDICAESARESMISNGLRVAGSEGFWQGYGALKHRDGSEIPVWQSMLVHRKPDDSIDFVSAIARDMTELKKAEDALQASQEKFSRAFHSSPDAVMITRIRDEAIVEVNEGFERLFGFKAEEAMGTTTAVLGIYADASGRGAVWNELRASGRVRDWTGEFVRRDGSRLQGILSTERFEFHGEEHVVTTIRDITERVRMEEQVRQSQKMETVGQLAGGIAHDFNNLLQVIQGYAQLAKVADVLPAERDEHLAQVLVASERASQLTRQLLAFGRRQPLRVVDSDFNQLVADHLRMIRRVIGENIKVEFIPGYALGNIRCDRVQIEQVLLNLCVNARDAMPEGGTLTIELQNAVVDRAFVAKHAWAQAGRYVVLTVTDTGCGMDRETCEHIFEPFFTTKALGTGLGLSVVYGIVRQHDGLLHVQSEPGAGTSFHVYLPVQQGNAAPKGVEQAASARGGSETILLAEDDSAVRSLSIRILERAGYRVLAAADGNEAVRLFRENPAGVDLVVLDVVMPNLGGRDASEEIRRLRADVPILFCSGYSGELLHSAADAGHILELIEKPYASANFLLRIREMLDNRNPGD